MCVFHHVTTPLFRLSSTFYFFFFLSFHSLFFPFLFPVLVGPCVSVFLSPHYTCVVCGCFQACSVCRALHFCCFLFFSCLLRFTLCIFSPLGGLYRRDREGSLVHSVLGLVLCFECELILHSSCAPASSGPLLISLLSLFQAVVRFACRTSLFHCFHYCTDSLFLIPIPLSYRSNLRSLFLV